MSDNKIVTESGKTITEQEAYAEVRRINSEEKDKQAKVENGKLKVQEVLKG